MLGVDLLAPHGPKYVGLDRALGRRIEAVGRRGKFLLVPLSGGLELVAHLGMTGVLAQEAPRGAAASHLRVRVALSGAAPATLYFVDPRRFGRFLVVDAGDYSQLPTLAALGPEPLDAGFTVAAFAAALARSRVAVKTYLLSQRPVAGVGNIYADEALWRRLTGYVSLRTVAAAPADRPEPSATVRQLRMTLRKTSTYLPDEALAARAGMSEAQLADYYAGLLHLDDPDPVVGFHALRDRQEALLARLRAARTVRIEGDGTDLTLSTAGRGWVNSYGRRNVPSGEMYTSPVETSAHGVIRFDVPSYNFPERVAGVTLEFDRGRLERATAVEGEATLTRRLAVDAGARVVGELGIGGNERMTRFLGATLFDEKTAGTVHLALGKSYPQTGGLNDSALHWDLIKDLRGGGRISLDGEIFAENGVFVGA